jgi:hypothetical protein
MIHSIFIFDECRMKFSLFATLTSPGNKQPQPRFSQVQPSPHQDIIQKNYKEAKKLTEEGLDSSGAELNARPFALRWGRCGCGSFIVVAC